MRYYESHVAVTVVPVGDTVERPQWICVTRADRSDMRCRSWYHANEYVDLRLRPLHRRALLLTADEVFRDVLGFSLKTNNGTRFAAGSWPKGEPAVFRGEGSLYNVTEGARFEHDADGHTHSPEERCRSCG